MIYKNPWIEVREDDVIHPNGQNGVFGIVTVKDGASVLPIDDDFCVYLVEEFHYGYGGISLEVPAGGIEKGESALEAAQRELREETGIEARQWTSFGSVNALTTLVRHTQGMYMAQGLTLSSSAPDGGERIKIKKLKLEDAVSLVMKGEIIDPTTGMLILKAAKYLGKL